MAYAYGRDKDLEIARAKANKIIEYFRGEYDAKTKLGEELRVGDLMPHLERSEEIVFGQLMADSTIGLTERIRIYHNGPLNLKQAVYDQVKPMINAQKEGNLDLAPLSIDLLIPEPSGMEQFRAQRAAEEAAREAARREGPTNIRQGSGPSALDASRN